MACVVLFQIALDDTQPLGPQIAAARAIGIPWKLLCAKIGYSRRHLHWLMVDAPDRVLPIFVKDKPARARAA